MNIHSNLIISFIAKFRLQSSLYWFWTLVCYYKYNILSHGLLFMLMLGCLDNIEVSAKADTTTHGVQKSVEVHEFGLYSDILCYQFAHLDYLITLSDSVFKHVYM